MTEEWVERILAYALIIGLLVSIFFNVRSCVDKRSLERVSDTVRVTIIDTIKVAPKVKDSVVVRYIIEKLPIAKDTSKLPASCQQVKPDTSAHLINEVSKKDSAEVIIPIEQKVYEDSLYKAYVSGYKPSLDSLLIYPRKETITITNKTYHKPKRFGIGVQVGYGVTIGEQAKFVPYVGVGISYNFLTF